jgi:hypothetical protein
MGNEMLWAAVHAERTALARDLDSLSDQQWSAPTACPGWDHRHEGETPGARLPQRPALAGEATAHNGLIPIEGVVAVWKSPALSSGLAIVDEVSEPTRGSHRGVRVIR